MSLINDKLVFVGWMQDGKSDKVWICYHLKDVNHERKYVAIYGRRGKALRISYFSVDAWWADGSPREDAETKIRQKLNKGYVEVDKSNLNDVYPEFEEDISMTAVVAELSA